MDQLYSDSENSIIFFGHSHLFSDSQSENRYVNPSSLGCQHNGNIKFSIITFFDDNSYRIEHYEVKYNKDKIIKKIKELIYSDYKTILKVFYSYS